MVGAHRSACMLAACTMLFTVGCAKDESSSLKDGGGALPPVESATQAAPQAEEPKEEELSSDIGTAPFDFESLRLPAAVKRATAHAKYLDAPTEFMTLDVPEGDTAVVGYRSSVMYPADTALATPALESLPAGTPLPFGEVIPILGKIECKDQKYYGMFQFQEHYNFFYKTRFGGKEGIVFGSDLAGAGELAAKNAKTSQYYKSAGRFVQFPPFAGYYDLSGSEKKALASQRIAFQAVSASEYHLSAAAPDDMIALYLEEHEDWMRPIFVTTDLYAHSLHLFFDKFLQNAEEWVFVPRLLRLIEGYLAVLDELEREAQAKGEADGSLYLGTIVLATRYFQVAEALLKQAPDVEVATTYGVSNATYKERDVDAIASQYPEPVRKELELIRGASGFQRSPLFDYDEDYSQYKPRGHYTGNGVLQAYFRAMMWFGRIHIYVSTGKVQPTVSEGLDVPSGLPTAAELSLKTAPVAFLVTELTRKDESLKQQWAALFDPITQLIGMSDDLSLYDMLPFWGKIGASDFATWLTVENVNEAVNKAHEELRPPLIFGNAPLQAPSERDDEGNLKPPMGWRLFGQRFTYDSYIQQNVVPPAFVAEGPDSRNLTRGLDVMKVFGSVTADALLGQEYELYPGLEERMDLLQAKFDEWSPDVWTQTYYSRVLYLIKSQATFEPGAGFYFTETPAWGIKAQLASHGTWAALRHDTILYVKQAYGERSGDGFFGPTSRVEPLPRPVHYIEPNTAFFEGALAAVDHLAGVAERYKLADEGFSRKVKAWRELLVRSGSIVAAECADQPVPAKDVEWIATVPRQMPYLVLAPGNEQVSVEAEKYRGAIIADVFTDAFSMMALEVGIGIPYRLYVALNDGQGGKRIAVGYTFSYYEFYHPIGARMTNEEWRKLVYGRESSLEGKKPSWSQGIALPAR